MGIQSLPVKAALLIPYLILVVMFPCTRGERLQRYHFFQLTETYHTVHLDDFPVVGKVAPLHLSLFFYPAKRNPQTAVYATIIPVEAGTGLNVVLPLPPVSGPRSLPCFVKTVSGLSPPLRSDG